MKFFLFLACLSLLSGCFSIPHRDSKLKYDNRHLLNTEVTADMNFLGKTVGTGKRYELFGLLRWGDSGRASYEGEYDDNFFGNERIRCTKQAAVFNALQGQDDGY